MAPHLAPEQLEAAKHTMRRAVLARRDALPAAERARASAAICAQLARELGHLEPRATVAAFSAIRSEVDLSAFIRAAYGRGLRVAFPSMERCRAVAHTANVTDAVTSESAAPLPTVPCTMRLRAVDPAEYETSVVPFVKRPVRTFDPTPADSSRFPLVAPAELALIIVPLVAFDSRGGRLGYGGGNYDRLLPQLSPNCTVIGAAFSCQQVPAVPCEAHDLPLPHIISA